MSVPEQISIVQTDAHLVIRFPKHSDLDMKIYNPAFFNLLGFHNVETSIVLPTTQGGGDGTGEPVVVNQHLTYPYKYFQFLFKRFTPSPGSLALVPTIYSKPKEPVAAESSYDVEPAKEVKVIEFPKSKFNPLHSIGNVLSGMYNNIHLPHFSKKDNNPPQAPGYLRNTTSPQVAKRNDSVNYLNLYEKKKSPEKESSIFSLFKTTPVEMNIPKSSDKPVENENPEKSLDAKREESHDLSYLESKGEVHKEQKETPLEIKSPMVEPLVLTHPDEDIPPHEDIPKPAIVAEPVVVETVEIIIPLDSNPERAKDDDMAAQEDAIFEDVLRFSRLEHQYSVYVRGEFQYVLGRLIKLGQVEQQSPETPNTIAEYLYERATLDNTKMDKYAKLYSPKK